MGAFFLAAHFPRHGKLEPEAAVLALYPGDTSAQVGMVVLL